MGDETKEFCKNCGVLIEKNLYDKLVYPTMEFAEGKYCFSCGKRKREANMKK